MNTPIRRRPRQSLVIYAKNKRRVSAFYQGVLGLEVVESDAAFDLLAGPSVEVVVHAIPKAWAAGITISRPPVLREDAAIKPVFAVASLDAARQAAQRLGGGLRGAEAAWAWRGQWQLSGWDPEGNIVQFTQRQRRAAQPA
jgi:predicted enzyme related to lactoylglutathione lyase